VRSRAPLKLWGSGWAKTRRMFISKGGLNAAKLLLPLPQLLVDSSL
jgi:hypothetical protein